LFAGAATLSNSESLYNRAIHEKMIAFCFAAVPGNKRRCEFKLIDWSLAKRGNDLVCQSMKLGATSISRT
jgi:hypothetical protein